MKPNIKTTQAFYHHLGKLFYAVAFSDKTVHEEEFKTLQNYIQEFWVDYDDLNDALDGDAALLIEIVFEGVQFFEENAADMYEAFVRYKNEQPQLFNRQVNLLIVETARGIAYSYAGLNKSESIMINNLELELNRL
jgi:RNAse (barnase) inhibitor barstar